MVLFVIAKLSRVEPGRSCLKVGFGWKLLVFYLLFKTFNLISQLFVLLPVISILPLEHIYLFPHFSDHFIFFLHLHTFVSQRLDQPIDLLGSSIRLLSSSRLCLKIPIRLCIHQIQWFLFVAKDMPSSFLERNLLVCGFPERLVVRIIKPAFVQILGKHRIRIQTHFIILEDKTLDSKALWLFLLMNQI